MDKTQNIYNNFLCLEVFCLDIIEGAKEWQQRHPARREGDTLRDQVEFWVENSLRPAIECALDDIFDEEED